ncbi:MAG: hypothetical protein A2V98_26315 [Planctomycetes bacterium RBG_16_64_12]|nr:MAG: hypothetical protein A2V98_26315 [Planctomycetes bacterium RBG_16_64_12]
MLGALVGAGLAIAAVGAAPNRNEGFGPRVGSYEEAKQAGDLIALSTVVDGRYQQVTVIDPKLRAIGVYQIELASGEVELRCVRDIRWDLQIEYFNGKGLSPLEIRSMLESR